MKEIEIEESAPEKNKITAHNLRKLAAKAGLSRLELGKLYGSQDFVRQCWAGLRPVDKASALKFMEIFAGYGLRVAYHDFNKDPSAIDLTERKAPVFRASAGTLDQLSTERGFPMELAEDRQLTNSEDLNSFWVIVEGEQMIGAGFQEGDRVLIEPGRAYGKGDTVFVRSDSGPSLKRVFVNSKNNVVLVPLKPDYPPIMITDLTKVENMIIWRVSGQFRTH